MVEDKQGTGGEKEMKPRDTGPPILEDTRISVRIVLAGMWIAHFLLWTFGDMMALLQKTVEPASSDLALFVAAPTAVVQAFMIIFTLTGASRLVRWANICVAPIYLLFNIGYLSEQGEGWHNLLGIAYLLISVLIIWYAWKWPTQARKEATA